MIRKRNAKLAAMVNMLNDGDFHDGNSIGLALGMTRSAVWKAIKKLTQYGIKINSSKGKGYALQEPLILLDPALITAGLKHSSIGLACYESIDSTNTYLRNGKKSKTIQVCLAEQQTKGKGRLNRVWHSPFGENIYLSLFYPFRKDISELAGLSLVTSLALFAALKEFIPANLLSVKWPNDIISAGKKLSGTLVEIQAETHGESQVVIGIGINVNMQEDNNEITQGWTSMRNITQRYFDRNAVCISLINHLIDYLEKFEQQSFAPFISEWMQVDSLMQQEIAIHNINEKIQGTVMGINEQGHLLLRMSNGVIRAFSSGDTTVLKEGAAS